jgi:ATPase subunit of ABC transporter with duplicated ATPase domains
VIDGFSGIVRRGEKIALMGRNGAGKTTMLRTLLANAPAVDEKIAEAIDSGTVGWGHEAAVGYFAQDHRESIPPGMTALSWLHQFDPKASNEELRGLLGQMLFAGEEGLKPTEALSGGEAARLIMCKLMLQKPNILVMDEPTNHLDLESINALNIALQKYDGTVLFVTHDEDLLDEVATRLWRFQDGKIEDFDGKLEDYLQDAAAPK